MISGGYISDPEWARLHNQGPDAELAAAEAWIPQDTGPRELQDWERDLIAPYEGESAGRPE